MKKEGNLFARLRRWIESVEHKDEEQKELAIFLQWSALMIVAIGLLTILIYVFIIPRPTTARDVVILTLVVIGMLWFTRHRRPELAGNVILGFLLIVLTYEMYYAGGMHSIAVVLYPALVIFASLILSRLWFRLFLSMMVGAISFLSFAEIQGWISIASAETASLGTFLVYVLLIGGTAMIGRMLNRNLIQARLRVREDQRTLEAQKALLEQSETRFHGLFKHSMDAMVLTDEEGRIVEINPAAEKLFQLERGETLGKSLWEIQALRSSRRGDTQPTAETIRGSVQGALQNGQAPWLGRMSEVQILLPDDGMRYVQQMVFSVPHQDRFRLASISRDVTEQKLAQLKEQRRRMMLERVLQLGKNIAIRTSLRDCLLEIYHSVQQGLEFDRVGVFLYDEASNLVSGSFGTNASGELEEMFSFHAPVMEQDGWHIALQSPNGFNMFQDLSRETTHKDSEPAIHGVKQHLTVSAWAGDKPVALIAVDNLLTQRPFEEEQIESLQLLAGYAGLAIENARANEILLQRLADLNAINIDNARLHTALHNELVERRQAEEEVRRLNAELEQRVIARTAELDAINRELEDLSYNIAHNLRSPVRAMVGYAQLLQENEAAQMEEDGRNKLAYLLNSSKRMGRLVDDFLHYLRVGQSPIRIQSVNTRVMVSTMIEAIQSEQSERKVAFSIGELPSCEADPALLETVWQELLSNAMKFTRTRAQPSIEVGSSEKDGKVLYFVRDNGMGFDMRYARRIFNAFQHLNRMEEFEGTGIGLAIAQRIVTRHGGSIWAEGKLDQGATFYFTLN